MLFLSFESLFPSGLGASQCSTNSRYGKGWLMISRVLESDVTSSPGKSILVITKNLPIWFLTRHGEINAHHYILPYFIY